MAQITDPKRIRVKITHLLDVYPGVSPTMLQAAMGPQVQPRYWKPILHELIQEEVVEMQRMPSTTPEGRYNDYIKLFLNGHDSNHA